MYAVRGRRCNTAWMRRGGDVVVVVVKKEGNEIEVRTRQGGK